MSDAKPTPDRGTNTTSMPAVPQDRTSGFGWFLGGMFILFNVVLTIWQVVFTLMKPPDYWHRDETARFSLGWAGVGAFLGGVPLAIGIFRRSTVAKWILLGIAALGTAIVFMFAILAAQRRPYDALIVAFASVVNMASWLLLLDTTPTRIKVAIGATLMIGLMAAGSLFVSDAILRVFAL